MAGHTVEQHISRSNGRRATLRIAGKRSDDLHAERFAFAPRRHQQQPGVLLLVDLVRMPQRNARALRKGLPLRGLAREVGSLSAGEQLFRH